MKQSTIKENNLETLTTQPFYNDRIPVDWTTPKFGEVFSFLRTFSFSREQLTNEKTSDQIQNIHYGDIHSTFENEILNFEIENRIPYVKDGLLSKEVMSDKEFPLLKDGDLIIADASEDYEGIAESVELKNVNVRKIISGLHTFAVRDTTGKTIEGFRTYILNHPAVKKEIYRVTQGISVYGVSKTNLAKIKIPLPQIPEQKAIAKLLINFDEAISRTEKLVTQKERQLKWLSQQLLTGKKRLRGFEAKNEKWKVQSIENFIKPIIREVAKPTQPYLGIGLRSHGKGTFLKPNEQPEKNSMDTFYIVRKNDLILNITFAWEQAIAIVKPEDDGALASHRFPTYIFTPNKGNCDFFRFFILQPRMKYMLELISPGGAGRNRVMSKSDFIKLEFPFPDYEEQIAIADVLKASKKEIQLMQDKSNKLREKKKGFMQILLTGKKRLK